MLAALLLFGVLGEVTRAADPADDYSGLNLIPWPQSVRLSEGRLKLTATSRIVAGQEELKPLAKVLAQEIALLTGLHLKTADDAERPGDIVLKVDRTIQAGEPLLAIRNRQLVRTREGAHRLSISERAVVEGFDYRAVVEGSGTLLQAIGQAGGQVSLPRLTIQDWPHADYCAMMVDVGRQNHPVDWLTKMVDVCRFYKVRYLQLHLTDDQGWTFPSTKYPQLGSRNYGAHGGVAPKVYTLNELKGLVAYADARGVTLVPEMEMPGHSGAALRSLPEVFDAMDSKSKQPVGMGCMNMASEEIYPALDTIIGEMCDVFRSSPYFHIGGDEVSMGRVALHSGYRAFMEKHGLKNDADLGSFFITRVNEIVKKHGKKSLKWEGLANEASKDIIVVAWDNNNKTAGHLIDKGFTTITCPWNLGVSWEDWNMYVCNGSRLKKGDSVLGATLVAWEQPPLTHLAGVRNVASRQERTWNPEHTVTAQGFALRFQALDAAVGKLVGMPVKPRLEATFAASAGTRDLLDPVFAFDGNDETFHQSEKAPSAGDHFTVMLKQPTLIHALEVHTGLNNKGLLDGGDVQVSED
jgi:hexosaminidase